MLIVKRHAFARSESAAFRPHIATNQTETKMNQGHITATLPHHRRSYAQSTFASLATTTALLAIQPQAASAADAAPPSASASAPATAASAANGDEAQLTRVIVTAQKREQASIDVPASVTAVSAARLANSGFTRLEDYAAQIPGLSFSSQRAGQTQVILRGITTGLAQSASTTSFYIDEAPIGSMNAYAAGSIITPDIDPADLRQIEVLKGPQGTLYGAGALGGTVRYVTVPPDFSKFGGSVTLGGSTVDHGGSGFVSRASLNIPIAVDSMGLRVSAFKRDDGGYIENPLTGERDVNNTHTEGGRLSFGWNLSSDWSLQASAMTQRIKSDGPSEIDVDHLTQQPLTGDLTHSSYVPEPSQANLNVFNATVRGMVGDYNLVSATTYEIIRSTKRQDETPLYGALLGPVLNIPTLGVDGGVDIGTKRWTQEVRARSTAFDGKVEYEGGLYLTKENSNFDIPGFTSFDTASGAVLPLPPLVTASILSTYEEASLFGNASYAVTPTIDLQAGARYGWNHQKYGQNYGGLLIGATPVVIDKTSDDRNATWMLSARWKPTSDEAFYVRAANGYRPGGPNAVPPAGVPGAQQSFAADSLVSYEVGYKAIFAKGRASFEAALFDTDWKNIQIGTSAQGYNFFVNGGTARSRGAEATFYVVPLSGLSLRASAAYTEAILTSDAPAAGGLDGDRLPFVPKVTASLTADYRWGWMADWYANLGGSVNFTGNRVSDFGQQLPLTVGSFTTANLNAGVENTNWRVTLYVKNLTDARGVTSLLGAAATPSSNPYLAGIIAPRTIGADVTYKF
jgi:iron complex outermembrane recepter protein